ncbi:MAG: hypothetical protein ACREEM_20260 [Blastocatellia bacterium]
MPTPGSHTARAPLEHVEHLHGEDGALEQTCYPFNFAGSAPKRFIVRVRGIPE